MEERIKPKLSFFNGASRGNPGETGAGGVLCSFGEITDISYILGLGIKSSNQSEALALLKDCLLARLVGYT